MIAYIRARMRLGTLRRRRQKTKPRFSTRQQAVSQVLYCTARGRSVPIASASTAFEPIVDGAAIIVENCLALP